METYLTLSVFNRLFNTLRKIYPVDIYDNNTIVDFLATLDEAPTYDELTNMFMEWINHNV